MRDELDNVTPELFGDTPGENGEPCKVALPGEPGRGVSTHWGAVTAAELGIPFTRGMLRDPWGCWKRSGDVFCDKACMTAVERRA